MADDHLGEGHGLFVIFEDGIDVDAVEVLQRDVRRDVRKGRDSVSAHLLEGQEVMAEGCLVARNHRAAKEEGGLDDAVFEAINVILLIAAFRLVGTLLCKAVLHVATHKDFAFDLCVEALFAEDVVVLQTLADDALDEVHEEYEDEGFELKGVGRNLDGFVLGADEEEAVEVLAHFAVLETLHEHCLEVDTGDFWPHYHSDALLLVNPIDADVVGEHKLRCSPIEVHAQEPQQPQVLRRNATAYLCL